MKEHTIDGLTFDEEFLKYLIRNEEEIEHKKTITSLVLGFNIGLIILQLVYFTTIILTMVIK